MGTYVTAQGLQIPTVQSLLDDTAADQRSTIDPNLNTDPDSLTGQLNGIVMNAIRQAWEAVYVAWNGNDPDQAEGSQLDAVAAITGTKRAPATSSKLTRTFAVRVNLNPNTFMPAGRGAAVLGNPSVSFHTVADFTAPNVVGAADYLLDMVSDATGSIVCNAGTLTVITTPVVGWNSVTNDYDALRGTNQDSDPQLRIRRESELRATGRGTIDSIQAELVSITLGDGSKPVTQAVVFENVSEVTDGNGLPGHSLRCLVFDGVSPTVADDTIAQVIWDSKPGGIQLTGNTSGTAIDSLGNARTVPFSRPTITQIDFQCTLTLSNPNQVPSQYLDIVQQTIIAEFGIKVRMGSVIRDRHYEGKVTDIPGIDDCVIRMKRHTDVSFLPADTNLALTTFEMGFTQTSGITVL